jgi:regulation of enolase protein 1 (concanavalin A-like superfamily)|tara:strand:- start:344 stop:574 length:231 start_codon:yes stop_codon:yes gene_type:complete
MMIRAVTTLNSNNWRTTMCELNATKEQVNVIIQRLEDAINVCYRAPENPDQEGYPYATGFARSAMQGAVEDLRNLM